MVDPAQDRGQRKMVNLRGALIFVIVILPATAGPWVGKSESELLASLGEPSGKASMGAKIIYQWPGREIVVQNGVVTADREKLPQPRTQISGEAQAQLQQKDRAIADLKAQLAREQDARRQARSVDARPADNPMSLAAIRGHQEKMDRRNTLRAQRASINADINHLEQEQRAIFATGGYSANANRRRNEIGQTINVKKEALRALDREIESLK